MQLTGIISIIIAVGDTAVRMSRNIRICAADGAIATHRAPPPRRASAAAASVGRSIDRRKRGASGAAVHRRGRRRRRLARPPRAPSHALALALPRALVRTRRAVRRLWPTLHEERNAHMQPPYYYLQQQQQLKAPEQHDPSRARPAPGSFTGQQPLLPLPPLLLPPPYRPDLPSPASRMMRVPSPGPPPPASPPRPAPSSHFRPAFGASQRHRAQPLFVPSDRAFAPPYAHPPPAAHEWSPHEGAPMRPSPAQVDADEVRAFDRASSRMYHTYRPSRHGRWEDSPPEPPLPPATERPFHDDPRRYPVGRPLPPSQPTLDSLVARAPWRTSSERGVHQEEHDDAAPYRTRPRLWAAPRSRSYEASDESEYEPKQSPMRPFSSRTLPAFRLPPQPPPARHTVASPTVPSASLVAATISGSVASVAAPSLPPLLDSQPLSTSSGPLDPHASAAAAAVPAPAPPSDITVKRAVDSLHRVASEPSVHRLARRATAMEVTESATLATLPVLSSRLEATASQPTLSDAGGVPFRTAHAASTASVPPPMVNVPASAALVDSIDASSAPDQAATMRHTGPPKMDNANARLGRPSALYDADTLDASGPSETPRLRLMKTDSTESRDAASLELPTPKDGAGVATGAATKDEILHCIESVESEISKTEHQLEHLRQVLAMSAPTEHEGTPMEEPSVSVPTATTPASPMSDVAVAADTDASSKPASALQLSLVQRIIAENQTLAAKVHAGLLSRLPAACRSAVTLVRGAHCVRKRRSAP